MLKATKTTSPYTLASHPPPRIIKFSQRFPLSSAGPLQVLDVWMQRRGSLGSKGSSAHLNHLSHQGPNEEASSPLISPSLAREKAVTSPQGGISMVKIDHDL